MFDVRSHPAPPVLSPYIMHTATCRGAVPACRRRLRRAQQTVTRAAGEQIKRDVSGAREPTNTELDFGFQERVLYDANTDHIRAIPSSFRKYIGLATKRCSPSPAGADPLAFRDAELLRKQVLDWKLVEEGPVLQLRRSWVAKDAAAAVELKARLNAVAAEEDYEAALHVSGDGTVTAVIVTPGLGGLTESDFVLAAKLDSLALTDLVIAQRRKTTYY